MRTEDSCPSRCGCRIPNQPISSGWAFCGSIPFFRQYLVTYRLRPHYLQLLCHPGKFIVRGDEAVFWASLSPSPGSSPTFCYINHIGRLSLWFKLIASRFWEQGGTSCPRLHSVYFKYPPIICLLQIFSNNIFTWDRLPPPPPILCQRKREQQIRALKFFCPWRQLEG